MIGGNDAPFNLDPHKRLQTPQLAAGDASIIGRRFDVLKILSMKIAYLHYHLKTGGVTTVIRQQAETIRTEADVLVLAGEPPQAPFPADCVTISGLGYDRPNGETRQDEVDKIADEILTVLRSRWGKGTGLVHIHNPTLAKNSRILKVIKQLQKNNIRLLLQIHDFAEDGRSTAYSAEAYPENCHYAVINSRDYRILRKAGLAAGGLHRLPNMIDDLFFKKTDIPAISHVLYPVRAIRRKNIGEAILLSLFFPDDVPLCITLPPNSPGDLLIYEDWKAFVRQKHLNVEFDAGLKNEFEDLVRSAAYFLTTSITEGFGFSFLEPWLAGKLLWGRKLNEVCRDFERNRVNLSHLYQRLQTPLDWINRDHLLDRLKTAVELNSRRFDLSIKQSDADLTFMQSFKNDRIDFGRMDEFFQKKIISRLISSETARNQLKTINPWLKHPARVKDKAALITGNKQAVHEHYNKHVYRRRLLDIYQKVLIAPVKQAIDKQVLLAEFFDLKSFSLLKWGGDGE